MKVDKLAASKNDEFYTPRYAVKAIVKFLKSKNFKIIWCPFDTKESFFVKVLEEEGFKVVYSHISNGQDFFEMKVPICDCIVSNPPYTLKSKVLDRLFNLKIPFAMLVGIAGLFESEKRFKMFESNDFEILYLNRRVSYFINYNREKKPSINPPFSSGYVCQNVLPRQICFERINKKDV